MRAFLLNSWVHWLSSHFSYPSTSSPIFCSSLSSSFSNYLFSWLVLVRKSGLKAFRKTLSSPCMPHPSWDGIRLVRWMMYLQGLCLDIITNEQIHKFRWQVFYWDAPNTTIQEGENLCGDSREQIKIEVRNSKRPWMWKILCP